MRIEPHANLTITLLRNHIYGVKRLRCSGARIVVHHVRPAVHARWVEPPDRTGRYEPRPYWPWCGVWPWVACLPCGTAVDVVA